MIAGGILLLNIDLENPVCFAFFLQHYCVFDSFLLLASMSAVHARLALSPRVLVPRGYDSPRVVCLREPMMQYRNCR
jgi:hypothetical protein